MTLLKDVPVVEICRAATWTSIHTFSKLDILIHTFRSDPMAGNSVLSSVLDTTLKRPPPPGDTAQESLKVEHPQKHFLKEEKLIILCGNWSSLKHYGSLWVLHYQSSFPWALEFRPMGLWSREGNDGGLLVHRYIYIYSVLDTRISGVQMWAKKELLLKISEQRYMGCMCTWSGAPREPHNSKNSSYCTRLVASPFKNLLFFLGSVNFFIKPPWKTQIVLNIWYNLLFALLERYLQNCENWTLWQY